MKDPTSPWNIKVKKNTNYTIQDSLEPSLTESEKKLPSLFLDALGGGKPKTISHKTSSISFKEVEALEDDTPPLNSIYSLNFSQIQNKNSSNTTVTLIGFPPSKEGKVLEIAEKLDQILEIKKSGKNGNWMVITFNSFRGVERILEYDGKMIDDSWILTVKVGELYNSWGVTESNEIKEARASKPSPLKISKRVEISEKDQEIFISRENEGTGRKEPMVGLDKEPQVLDRGVSLSSVDMEFPDEILRPSYWNQFKDVVFSW